MTIEQLTALGADTQSGVTRCMGNETFYLKMVEKALEADRFERLEKYIVAGDLDSAFDEAHALKGILANLALTPILEPVSEITELLRIRQAADYRDLLSEMRQQRNEFNKTVGGTAP